MLRRFSWFLLGAVGVVACGGGDGDAGSGDAGGLGGANVGGASGGTSGSGGGAAGSVAGSGGAAASGGTSASGGTFASGGTSASGGSGGSTPVACSASCTGTKLCDDDKNCVCAPGWEPSGADCVASAVSNPTKRTKAEVCSQYSAAKATGYKEWIAGTGGTCDPGTVPYSGQAATLRWLNFYRWMLGVGPVQVEPATAQGQQECAKILNYAFGHSPAPTVQCYTKLGAAACGSSLIASGYGLVGQVNGYALENDQNLIHRRNVLSVGRGGVWFGASGSGSNMHYGGKYTALSSDPAYVAHPGPGLNVKTAVPNVWFVQRGKASTPKLAARVFVVSSGKENPMKQGHYYTDFSSFSPDGWQPQLDVPYRVELRDDTGALFAQHETTFIACP